MELAKVADADGAADFLHELCVFYMDPDEGVLTHDGLLDKIANDPPPEDMTFGDCEPEIYGDIAFFAVPVDVSEEDAPPFDVNLAAVMLNGETGWQMVAACFIVRGMMEVFGPEDVAQLGGIVKELDELDGKLNEVYTTGGVAEFIELCDPEAAIVAPFGPGGELAVARAMDVADMLVGAPDMPMRRVEEPDTQKLVGPGAAFLSTTATITENGVTRTGRHIAMAVYKPGEAGWRIVAAVEAPIEE
jgi:hypothetical protein